MKIAHVVSTFSPYIGGMGKVCFDEAVGLARRGHDVTVFTLQYDTTDHSQHDAQLSFKVVRLRPWIKLGDAGFVPQLRKKLKMFDLVHLHYPFYGGAEWVLGGDVPFVITYHMDAQLYGFKSVIGRMYDLIWPRQLFTKAKKIITVNAQYVPRVISSEKIVLLPNAIDTDVFSPQAADYERVGLSRVRGKKIILFVGNLLPVKRLDILLQAMYELKNEAMLIVVGDGSERVVSERYVQQNNLTEHVYFAGACRDSQLLAAYYAVADCVVVPSDYESFSLVAAEAMACGKPLVLSEVVGLSAKIPSAFLFEKGSVHGFVLAVRSALAMPAEKRSVLAQAERDYAVARYGLSQHIAALEHLYQDVFNKKI